MSHNTANQHTETTGEAWAKALLTENNTSIENEKTMQSNTENNASARAETATTLLAITNDAANNLGEAQHQAADKVTEKHEKGLHSHIYKKVRLDMVKQKCSSIRSFCDGTTVIHMDDLYASKMTRLLAPFEGGVEFAENACIKLPNFEQARFDADILAGRTPGQAELTCAEIKLSSCASCPSGGCISPVGTVVVEPLELRNWACNTDKVGPRIMAKTIIDSDFGGEIFSLNDTVYMIEGSVYLTVADNEIIKRILAHSSNKVRASKLAEILKLIKAIATPLPTIGRPSANLICFNNGILNLETRVLEPHNAAHKLFNRIPHDHVSDAACERFLAFLQSIWGCDQDYAQKAQLLRQWIGYSLVADASLQKMLILSGKGANGKSVLMDLMQAIVGDDNVANAMLDRFHMPYVRATLEHKLVNFSADLPKKKLTADGDLKAIVGGDLIEVALKHKPSRTIKPYARLVVSTNNMADCHDTSDGYFRRLIILQFNRQFAEHERDPHLLQSLTPEIPGIIAWALSGLYELREQGRFSIPASSEQALQIYREELSHVMMFAEECLIPSTDRTGMLSKDLFGAYKNWCGKLGFAAGNIISLGRELGSLGFGQRKSGQTWWLVKASEIGVEYFGPAQTIPDMPMNQTMA